MKLKLFFTCVISFLFFADITRASTDPGDKYPEKGDKPSAEANQDYLKRIQGIGRNDETKYDRWAGLKYSGYIRSYTQFRDMPVRYEGVPAQQSLTLNGLDIIDRSVFSGYQEPLFLLRVEGAPTARTHFKIEYMFDHQMFGSMVDIDLNNLGMGPSNTGNRRTMVYRVFEFTGGLRTDIGAFKLMAGGGVMWYKLSPFTYWNYQYRDDMFERYPWEPQGSSWGRYNSFYGTEDIPRDARWGNTGTQGFILEGNELPYGLSFSLIYGKTDNSGGFQSYLSGSPKNVIAGRVRKMLGTHQIGIQYFNQYGQSSENALPSEIDPTIVEQHRIRQQILTGDVRLNFDGWSLYAELGMGRYQDSLIRKANQPDSVLGLYEEAGYEESGDYYVKGLNYDWANPLDAHALNIELKFDEEITKIPLKAQFYSVMPTVVNINSAVLNSSNPHALPSLDRVGGANDITTFPGAVTELYNDQMTNNRWGFRLKHDDTYGKLKVYAGLGWEKQHEHIYDDAGNLINQVSFLHEVNAFTRSRFRYYEQFIGPYDRIVNLFRRSYEKVDITDPEHLVDYKLGFNSLNLGLKYKFNVFNKELILSSFTNFNSVTEGFSPYPQITDEAFIRTFYQEFMGFLHVHPKVTILGFLGLERNLGNMRTELTNAEGELIQDDGNETYHPDGQPLNQIGRGYGVGIDYDITGRAGLHIRHRWFSHEDVNQILDQFKGTETTVELKIFF